jgi:hypothetical protein
LTLKALQYAKDLIVQAEQIFFALSPLQRFGVVLLGLFGVVTSILSLVYHQQIFHFMTYYAKKWRDIPGGWLILWAVTYVVSFPPLIGYSTCVGLGGFVFGLKGFVSSFDHLSRHTC